MDARQLRDRRRVDAELKSSGLKLTLELPNMLDCMIAVNVPLAVVKRVQEIALAAASPNGREPEALELVDLGHIRAANIEAVRRAVKALDGEPLAEPLTTEDVLQGFSEDELTEIMGYLNRDTSVPKAPSPTPEP